MRESAEPLLVILCLHATAKPCHCRHARLQTVMFCKWYSRRHAWASNISPTKLEVVQVHMLKCKLVVTAFPHTFSIFIVSVSDTKWWICYA